MTEPANVTEALESFSKRELSDIKVLMVEDDSFFADIVLTKLSHHGCIPYSTGNGDEAIGLATQYLPDVIVLDLMLPGLSGEEILAQLKANEELKNIPVIVFSNKSGQADIEANLKAGAAEYLVKSATDINTLVDIVKGVVMKARGELS